MKRDTNSVFVVTTPEFFDRLMAHRGMQRAKTKWLKHQMAKSHGAQWKRERVTSNKRP